MLVDFCKWNFPMNSHPHQLDGWMVGVSVGILFNNFLIAQEITLPTLLSDRLSKSSRQNMGWPENNQNTSYQPFTTPGEKRKATQPPRPSFAFSKCETNQKEKIEKFCRTDTLLLSAHHLLMQSCQGWKWKKKERKISKTDLKGFYTSHI